MTHPTFTVEIGNAPGLIPGTWIDVSSRLLDPEGDHGTDISYDYGRRDELAQDETGVASFTLDNADGNWTNGITPGTAVRITATLNSTDYPVCYGLVESAPVVWPAKGQDAVVDARIADGMTLLARTDLDEVLRDAERSGARIAALLDEAGWPAALRDIDTGRVILTELGEYDPDVDATVATSINTLHAIRDAVEAEQGQIYIAPDGTFTFRDRHARLNNTAVVEFGGAGVDYDALVPSFDDRTIWTVGRAEMADGGVVEFQNTSAVATFGRRVFMIRDLVTSDAEAEMVANWMTVRYATPARRFDRLEIEAVEAAQLVAVMTLRPGDLVRVQASPADGSTVDENVHVEKIDHRIGSSVWDATFHLSPYFGEGPWLTLDDLTLGQLDANKLAP